MVIFISKILFLIFPTSSNFRQRLNQDKTKLKPYYFNCFDKTPGVFGIIMIASNSDVKRRDIIIYDVVFSE